MNLIATTDVIACSRANYFKKIILEETDILSSAHDTVDKSMDFDIDTLHLIMLCIMLFLVFEVDDRFIPRVWTY